MANRLESQKQELDRWANAVGNMTELLSQFGYEVVINGSDLRPEVFGETRTIVEPLLKDFNALWVPLGAVLPKLREAESLYSDYQQWAAQPVTKRFFNGFKNEDEVAQKIEELLAALIKLPDIQKELKDRKLGDAGTVKRSMTTDELFAEMERVFEPLNQAVARIKDNMLASSARMQPIEKKLEKAERAAADLGMSLAELAQTRGKIDAWRTATTNNPLGPGDLTAGELAALSELVDAANAQIASTKELRANLPAHIAAAPAQLDEVRELLTQVREAWTEAQAKVANLALSAPHDDTAVTEYKDRLDAITEAAADAKGWRSAANALGIWTQQINGYINELTTALQANWAPITQRSDMRNLLGAYQIKAAAHGVAEDDELARIGGEVKNILYSRPSDLVRAQELIDQFSRRLDLLKSSRKSAASEVTAG